MNRDLDPVAFFSYAHRDDEHESGLLSRLRELLQGEATMQLGRDFVIFQDREHIQWGQAWRKRVDQGLDSAAILVPVITPSFFQSRECRREVQRFLELEKQLGRDDLVLPIYYVSCEEFHDRRTSGNYIGDILKSRQYVDWRVLRFESFSSSESRRTLAALAARLVEITSDDSADRPTLEAEENDFVNRYAIRSTFPDDSSGIEVARRRLAAGSAEDSRRLERYAVANTKLQRAYSALAEASWMARNEAISQDGFREHITVALRSLAEAYSFITEVKCRTIVRLMVASTGPGERSITLVTFATSDSVVWSKIGDREELFDTADYKAILLDGLGFFFVNDVHDALLRGYRNSHWKTDNDIRVDRYLYRSFITWPIERPRTKSDGLPETRNLLGFLSVEAPTAGSFSSTYDPPLGRAFSDLLHTALSAYRPRLPGAE